MNIRITRTSTRGLQVVYDSQLSATAQLGIGWRHWGGGVAMSIEQAEELQSLLGEVLRLASPAIDPIKEKSAAAVEAQLLPWRDRKALLVQPESPDLSGVTWPSPANVKARGMFIDGECVLLAQLDPPELTDQEIDDWCGECADLTRAGKADHYWVFGDVQGSDIDAIVRAAVARWGCPAHQIHQAELTDEDLISAHDLAIQWNQQADADNQWDTLDLYEQLAWAQSRAIAADRARQLP